MSKVLERNPPGTGATTLNNSASPPETKKHEKTVPHYLRASRGSCHDLCKYGHKHPSEEETSFSGGRRKKLPTQLINLTLHRSAILDTSKDVKHRNLSLARSSISLGEAERVAPKITSANRKGVASNEHLVPQTATPDKHKNLNSDGKKKHSIVAQKVPTNLKHSSGVPQFEKIATVPTKRDLFASKSKSLEKSLLEKSRTVDKVITANQLLNKRPDSSPTVLNMSKQMHVPSRSSSHHLLSKDKSTPKGKIISPSSTLTRVRAKPGRSPMRSSNVNGNGKEGYIFRPPFVVEPKLTASVELQEDDAQITGNCVKSTLEELSSDATETIDDSGPAPEELSKSISEDSGLGSTEKSDGSTSEALLQSASAIELHQSLDDQEFNATLGEPDPEHKLAEQNVIQGRTSKDRENQTNDETLFQLSKQLNAVENADVYVSVFTESNSKFDNDHVEVDASVDSLTSEGKEDVEVHKYVETSPELLALDERNAEKPESCFDFASENAADTDKADEVVDSKVNNCASHCQLISEASSEGGLPEESKSTPCDSAIDGLLNVSNENNSEQDKLKSRIFLPQSPEELSDNDFYEEYDFEISESDESGTEDEEATTNGNRDESTSAGEQRPRRISSHELDDVSITPYKLKFKRGKIVELPPDISGPRRLKFSIKTANEVPNRGSQSAKKVYRKNSTNNAVPTNTDVDSPGVKLRHQDTQEKKDAQGLFNNVIEKTASKLVESRKSKVKALVGAFETVISLQDGKPTSSAPQASNSQDLVHGDEENTPEGA